MLKYFYCFAFVLFAASSCKMTYGGNAFNELAMPSASNGYKWVENDSTFALVRNDRVIWQYNFNTKFNKPFFHPVRVNDNTITGLSPNDHIWHLGQWFSWKYINRANYWEYVRGSYSSEGVTNIRSVVTRKKPDHSAVILLEIEYHPQNQEAVLKEKREIHIAPPQQDGSIMMDYHFTFSPLTEKVIIDRTPIDGEPNGRTWGGYGGLSIRFNLDLKNTVVISDVSEGDNMHGITGDWLYMGFTGTDGKRVGSLIMIDKETKGAGEAWYVTNNPNIPFYFINPAYVFLKPKTLHKGETLNMKYRVLHLEGTATKEELTKKYKKYKNP